MQGCRSATDQTQRKSASLALEGRWSSSSYATGLRQLREGAETTRPAKQQFVAELL